MKILITNLPLHQTCRTLYKFETYILHKPSYSRLCIQIPKCLLSLQQRSVRGHVCTTPLNWPTQKIPIWCRNLGLISYTIRVIANSKYSGQGVLTPFWWGRNSPSLLISLLFRLIQAADDNSVINTMH